MCTSFFCSARGGFDEAGFTGDGVVVGGASGTGVVDF